MKHGDFTHLARDYAESRPGYAPSVARVVAALTEPETTAVQAADVGAGTGIWTRQLYDTGIRALHAVEPNDAMRAEGLAANEHRSIVWQAGSGEETGLAEGSLDLLSMASSFHWTDYERATAEFHRVLRPGGLFVALWNTRFLKPSPMLLEIEAKLREIVPDLKRVSSGRSAFTDGLLDRMMKTQGFEDPMYLEGFHTEIMSPDRYLSAWRSVNDVQVQAGPERFAQFLDYVDARVSGLTEIPSVYQTRTWLMRRV